MTDDTPLPFDLPSVRRKKLTVDFAGGNQSSNGGVLLLREAERKHGVCLRLAEAMPDRRDPDRIRHAMFEMVMSRVLAIACGHEDVIDLDRLRHDPLMKLAVGRCRRAGNRWPRNRPSAVWRMCRARPRQRGLPRLCSISSARP
jgi:DDE family transposase